MSVVIDKLLGKPLMHDHTRELDTRYLQLAGDTMSGDLNLGGNQLYSVRKLRAVSGNNFDFILGGDTDSHLFVIGNNSENSYPIRFSATGKGWIDNTLNVGGATEISNTLKATRIGLGGANPESTRLINADGTFGDGGAFGFNALTRVNPDTDNGDYYFGGYLSAQSTSDSTHNAAGFRGLKVFGEHNGTGTIGSIYGAEFQVGNTSTGVITNAVGFKVLAPYNSGGGTISDYIGIEMESPSIGRSIVVRGGEIVFNDYSETEADFVVRGDTVYELFKVDTSADLVIVNGTFKSAGYQSSDGSSGVSGSFTTVDSKTVTVKDGLITSIV